MNLFDCFNCERRKRLAEARHIRAMSLQWYRLNRTMYLIRRELER